MRTLLFSLTALLLTAGSLVLSGCGDGGNGGSGTGTVKLLVGDAPLHLDDGTVVSEVTVMVTGVELIGADENQPQVTLFNGQQAINLLSLANKPLDALLQLALVTVPAQTYQQLRFIIDEAESYVMVDGVRKPLKVASGSETGLKVNIDLAVASGVTQAILLDFDLTKLHQNNQFLLTPNAVRAVALADAGTVAGTVALPQGATPAADVVVTLTIHPTETTTPLATTQVVLNAATSQTAFTFNGIPVGSYVVSANAAYQQQTVAIDVQPVNVTAGGTAALGEVSITGLTF